MKTYSQHIIEVENGKREIYPFNYLEFYVDNIQPYTQFEDSPEKIYEGITEDDFFKSYPNGFSDLFKLLLFDKRLIQLQDELENEHKQVCLFNMAVLSQFLIERGKSRYLYLLRPSISETLAELKDVSKITFTNKDGSMVESKSTILIKKVMETLESEKDSDALNCQVEKIVTWDKFSNNSIMQSYFVHDLTMFLHKYFPIKRKKDALISTKEVDFVKAELNEIFNNPDTESWFNGTFQKVWNERTIIANELYRPDRIMEKDGELLVVDYKFGEENKKYDAQLKNYISLLKSMNKWSEVRGCLYYHHKRAIKNVRG